MSDFSDMARLLKAVKAVNKRLQGLTVCQDRWDTGMRAASSGCQKLNLKY